ncbi:hypothetical protein EBZ57_01455 [bacterium]|nr:hypothetical protein [bacterium]
MNLVYKIYFAAQTTVQQDINSLNPDTLPKNNLGNSDLQNVLSIVFGVAAVIAVLQSQKYHFICHNWTFCFSFCRGYSGICA